jgi:hypothetical protein
MSGLRTRTVPAYAAAFYLATLSIAPTRGPTGTFMAERFLFAPSAGAMLGMAWACSSRSIEPRRQPRARRLRPR